MTVVEHDAEWLQALLSQVPERVGVVEGATRFERKKRGQLLEAMAAELAVRRKPSEAQLKPLLAASRDMGRALQADDLDEWAAAACPGADLLWRVVVQHQDRGGCAGGQ